jgi:transposase InsO family protein
VKFAFIRDNRKFFNTSVMCEVLDVTLAGFYAWLKRPDSKRAVRTKGLAEQIRVVHQEVDGVYGCIKITRELKARNHKANRKTIARIMAKLGIRSIVSRKFRIQTTDSNHANPIAPNTLDRKFTQATAPNQFWSTDITYIHTDEGVLYLAGVMDLFSRKIVGWSMDATMTTDLVETALGSAVLSRKPAFGLLHHSDRGVQYTSGRYRQLLDLHGMAPSMSRTGNCYDNAVVESFWGKLKTEMVYHRKFATREEARAAVFEYIEMFYNRQRLHAALDYKSPEQFEASQIGKSN